MSEDAEIQTKLFDRPSKVKFSNKNVKGTMSLKQYHWDWKRSTCNTHIWWTPYLESKFNRDLRNTTLSLGSLGHVNNYYMEHFRLNL